MDLNTHADWKKFPTHSLQLASNIYRIYRSYYEDGSHRSPWFFSSTSVENPSRFDLPEPKGTCYFASTKFGAWSETFRGPRVTSRQEVEKRSLVRAHRKNQVLPLSDLTSRGSTSYGLTLDVAAGGDYSQTQEIARLLFKANSKGVRSFLRKSPTALLYTFGIFGSAGAHSSARGWKSETSKLMDETELLETAVEYGYKVVDIPHEMPIAQPKVLASARSVVLTTNKKSQPKATRSRRINTAKGKRKKKVSTHY